MRNSAFWPFCALIACVRQRVERVYNVRRDTKRPGVFIAFLAPLFSLLSAFDGMKGSQKTISTIFLLFCMGVKLGR